MVVLISQKILVNDLDRQCTSSFLCWNFLGKISKFKRLFLCAVQAL